MKSSEQQKIIDHFNKYPWKYWGTLTSKKKVSPDVLEKALKKWIRRLQITNQSKCHFLYVIEESPSGHSHIHFQLGELNISVPKMKELWITSGGGVVNQIEPYNEAHGSGYTVKHWFDSDYKGVDTPRTIGVRE